MKPIRYAYRGFFFLLLLIGLVGCKCGEEAVSYGYREGQVASYKFWMTQQAESPAGEESSQRFLIRMRMDLAVEAISQDKTATLKLALHEVQASISSQEGRKPLDQFNDLSKTTYRIRQAADGKILDLQLIESPGEALAAFTGSLAMAIREMLPTLPMRLNRGTSWSRKIAFTAKDNSPYRIDTSFEVGTQKMMNEHQSLEFAMQFQIFLGEAVDGVNSERLAKAAESGGQLLEGRGTGSGRVYFDPKAGQFVGARYDTRVKVGMLSTAGELENPQVTLSHIEVQLTSIAQAKGKE